MSADGQDEYVAYLLRLWRGHREAAEPRTAGWHASLEHVQTGERIGFSNLDELFAFLKCEVTGKGTEAMSQDSRVDNDERR